MSLDNISPFSKKRPGKPRHKPTDVTKRQVETLSGFGLCHENIAAIIGIDDKTLRLYYREEIDLGRAKANANVAKSLYNSATSGDTTAAIFWAKARMGWTEKSHLVVERKLEELSDEELDKLIEKLTVETGLVGIFRGTEAAATGEQIKVLPALP